jgi:hypothetical protein
MEFTLRTPDSFRGRIYTYKHFDRPKCFASGNGDRVHVLRIPGVNGFPDCGTEQAGQGCQRVWYILCSFGTFFRFWYHVPRKIWQP